MAESGQIAVLVKVVPLRVDVHALTGAVTIDEQMLGVSPSDRAALAVGISLGEKFDAPVVVYSVAPPQAEASLVELVACGASRGVRVSLSGDDALEPRQWLAAYSSATVVDALSREVGDARYILTGDHSLDRGSATVPSRLAQRLGLEQALGVLEVDVANTRVTRRLAAGWREQLTLPARAVVSVEASAGLLARAGVSAWRRTSLDVVASPVSLSLGQDAGEFAPYRPPLDVVDAPREVTAARRAMEVIGATVAPRRREVMRMEPDEAAREILSRLRAWGYT